MRIRYFDYLLSLCEEGGPNPYYFPIHDLSKTAVQKFGKNPEPFRKTLNKYKPENFKKDAEEALRNLPAFDIGYSDFFIEEFLDCLTAILQVDLECPGFIKNFPEAIEYREILNSHYHKDAFDERYERLFSDVVKTYNRYSGESDYEYVKELFEIPESKDIRFDDYISVNFLRFWKSGNEEMEYYLRKNYIHPETLLPEDFKDILVTLKIKSDEDDSDWIDFYFANFEKIIGEVHEDINKLSPSIMKKINLTKT